VFICLFVCLTQDQQIRSQVMATVILTKASAGFLFVPKTGHCWSDIHLCIILSHFIQILFSVLITY